MMSTSSPNRDSWCGNQLEQEQEHDDSGNCSPRHVTPERRRGILGFRAEVRKPQSTTTAMARIKAMIPRSRPANRRREGGRERCRPRPNRTQREEKDDQKNAASPNIQSSRLSFEKVHHTLLIA